MKICVVSNGYPSKKEPQRGCFELDQAQALKKAGNDVDILYLDGSFRLFWRKIGVKHFEDDFGINVYRLFLFPLFLFSKVLSNFLYLKLQQKLFLYLFDKYVADKGIPDVIYAHFLPNMAQSIVIKNKYDCPVVGIEHWSVLNNSMLTDYVRFLGDSTYCRLDALITVSCSLQKMLNKHFRQESVVIYNMVSDIFMNTPINATLNGKIKYVATGSLIHRKGFDLLPKAFANLNLPKDKWEMNIIGGGEERENLQKQINDLDLQDNIHLLGQKTKSEIVSILKDSNVFILPSRNENFSVAVLEALACGLPVISSICGGIRECISDFNGLLFTVDDVDALADTIKYMFENYQLYDRANIAEDCKNRFSPDVIARQLTDVFEKIIDKSKK